MIAALILIIFKALWVMSEDITEFLSKGKFFAPNETKW
jgi:hypothetical protein